MVGDAGNAPVVTSDSCLRHRFYRPAAGTPPQIGRGGGSYPTHWITPIIRSTFLCGAARGSSGKHLVGRTIATDKTTSQRLQKVQHAAAGSPTCSRVLLKACALPKAFQDFFFHREVRLEIPTGRGHRAVAEVVTDTSQLHASLKQCNRATVAQ